MLRVVPNRHRRCTLIGVVGLLFVTAGCLGTPGTEVDEPSAVAEQVESRYDHLDGFQADMVRTVTVDNDTRTTRATVAFDKGETLTIAYRTGPQAGTVTVIENPAERVFRTEQRRADAGARVAAVAADLTRRNEVVFEGTQRLDGTVTAVFSIEPPANAAESRPERRVWSDVTRAIPLRITSTWTASGQTVSETIRFTDVSLGEPNAQLSDESPSNPGRQRTGTRGAVA